VEAEVVVTALIEAVAEGECVLLHGVSWTTYEALLEEVLNRRVRLTYDRGELEIMTPSNEHERCKRKTGRLIETMTEELGIPIQSGGSTTFKDALKKKGLEPDECYWIANEARVRDVEEIDLARDPPPDLVVEVEVSRSAVDRLGIYASFGFGEIWRWRKGRLVFLRLQDGEYVEAKTSAAFPFLTPEPFERFLKEAHLTDETTWIRKFRAWIRETFPNERRG